ncbi:7635_t:CDS:2 [Ambispora leptoticha]|uniref:Transcription elongation factor 1 homolog n=1 Tax=Ambispora leptoticha TaxID=144679 RepID=A0A9N8WLP0_9GLOM|nr:7635_t:CDS:2 [Ambispora leptoticha]
MDREQRIGSLKCRVCFVTFQSNIHQLSDPVDVYHEWIDASEDTRQEQRPGSKRPNNRMPGEAVIVVAVAVVFEIPLNSISMTMMRMILIKNQFMNSLSIVN